MIKPGQIVGRVTKFAKAGDLVTMDIETEGGKTFQPVVSASSPEFEAAHKIIAGDHPNCRCVANGVLHDKSIDEMYIKAGVLTPEEVAQARYFAQPAEKPKTRVCSILGTEQKLIDDLTPDECLAAYARMQRDERLDKPLTRLQLSCARALWAHDVKIKVQASAALDASRAPAPIAVDDDRWEE